MELRVGCSSWTSDAWAGRVYPRGLADGERLSVYAKLFDTVEVDSTYYRSPPPTMVEGWRRKTPPEFRFTLKFPRDLLDPKVPVDTEAVANFVATARRLNEKLGAILLQFPPWVRPGRSQEFLTGLLDALESGPRYAVELREAGWFQGEVREWLLKNLRDRHIALAWSYLTYVEVPPERTADFVYLRFIGDHETIPAASHGEVRVDRSPVTALWAARLRDVRDTAQMAFVFFNNHYAGFAPASVNDFRVEMGLPKVDHGRLARGARRLDADEVP
ncbi:MAG: DUF72 domain-containing protein [Thermoplasmata archaeon]|nr:DUF72 domain-containing protein [Thermoplasmata archaeon]